MDGRGGIGMDGWRGLDGRGEGRGMNVREDGLCHWSVRR